MNRLLLLCAGCVPLFVATVGRADLPLDYKGKPFDPALAGGVGKIPPTVQAGPYALPGRLDFINYDLGGEGIAYHAGDHITNNGSESVKEALGYRTDAPTATLCLTNQVEKDSWYQTSAALDGTPFPSATTVDYYIGATRPNDWYNFTVNVSATGTYELSSAWASGNGPPGGEGGDGSMELQIYANLVMKADWKATFPNSQTKANFHNWVAYPKFATVQLDAGLQVIKLQAVDAHLNLAYVQFSFVEPDGGLNDGSGAGASAGGASAAGGADNGASGSTGASGAPTGNSGGAAGGTSSSDSGGSPGTAGAASNAAGTGGSAPTSAGAQTNNDSSCAVSLPGQRSREYEFALALFAAAVVARRRARRSARLLLRQ
jgi:hypothetical protein